MIFMGAESADSSTYSVANELGLGDPESIDADDAMNYKENLVDSLLSEAASGFDDLMQR